MMDLLLDWGPLGMVLALLAKGSRDITGDQRQLDDDIDAIRRDAPAALRLTIAEQWDPRLRAGSPTTSTAVRA